MASLRRFVLLLVASALVATPTAAAEDLPDLWITRYEGSGPPEYQYRAFNGQTVYYLIDVTNRSTVTATGVVATATLPPELTYDASRTDSRCSLSGSIVTCNLGSVSQWQSETIAIYTIASSAGTFASSASVAGNEGDATPADNSAVTSVTVAPAADVEMTIAGSADVVRVGSSVTYTVDVTNNGPDAATAGHVNVNWQPFGPQAALVSFTSTSALTCVESSFLYLDCDFAALAPGETATLTAEIAYAGKGTGTVETRGYVIANEWDPVANNQPVATTTVVRHRVK